jgi:nitrogen fixation protein NifB
MILLPFEKKMKPCEKSMQIDSLILPAAPQANSGKRFGDSGGATPAMLPSEAVSWLSELVKGGKKIHGVNICGPGDALAAPEILFTVLDLLRERYPDCQLKLTSSGLGAALFAQDLATKGVGQVDLQIEAVSADIVKKIYAWIRPGKKTVPLAEAAEFLLTEQEEAIIALTKAGIRVHILSTVYPDLNNQHLGEVAAKMASLGAATMTIVPFQPLSEEEDLPACDAVMLEVAKKVAGEHLEIVSYGEDCLTPPGSDNFQGQGVLLPKPNKERPNVAVASSNGMDVDLHLGQAAKILIYGPREDGLACLLESRTVPEAESGNSRWEVLAKDCLFDCFALLASSAGENPQKVLAEQGIKVLLIEDNIEGTVDVLYGGGKKKKCKK